MCEVPIVVFGAKSGEINPVSSKVANFAHMNIADEQGGMFLPIHGFEGMQLHGFPGNINI